MRQPPQLPIARQRGGDKCADRRERRAAKQIDGYERNGFGRFPVCIAKTHLSLSSDPKLTGAPTGWRLPVREARANVGAGLVYLICGEMRTMPGLGTLPAATRIDIDADGEVVGAVLTGRTALLCSVVPCAAAPIWRSTRSVGC